MTTYNFNCAPDDQIILRVQNTSLVVSAVPEPASYAMLLAGLAGIAFAARRRAG